MLLQPYAFALQTFIVAYLVLADPLYGRFAYHRLEVTVDSDPGARLRFYRGIILVEWFMAGLAALSLYLDGNGLDAVGLRPVNPDSMSLVWGIAAGVVAALVLGQVLAGFVPSIRRSGSLLPTRGAEYLLYGALAITAGICEEVLFRGLVLGYLGTWVPDLPIWGAVGISAVIFGWAHLYQGWKGMLGSGLLGVVLGGIYLYTGSLWPSIVLHALIDLNAPLTAWLVQRGEARAQRRAA